jgi:hypothetical protein
MQLVKKTSNPMKARLNQPSILALGQNIGGQLALQERDLVFQQEFAFFHAAQLKLVRHSARGHSVNGVIEIAMFFSKA